MVISIASGPGWFAGRAYFDPHASSGVKAMLNSSFSPCCAWNASAEAGCALLHTSVFPENRMHNERCTSGSEGGHRNPMAAMPHGADARPYLTFDGKPSS